MSKHSDALWNAHLELTRARFALRQAARDCGAIASRAHTDIFPSDTGQASARMDAALFTVLYCARRVRDLECEGTL
jgi:hypothetical protein